MVLLTTPLSKSSNFSLLVTGLGTAADWWMDFTTSCTGSWVSASFLNQVRMVSWFIPEKLYNCHMLIYLIHVHSLVNAVSIYNVYCTKCILLKVINVIIKLHFLNFIHFRIYFLWYDKIKVKHLSALKIFKEDRQSFICQHR